MTDATITPSTDDKGVPFGQAISPKGAIFPYFGKRKDGLIHIEIYIASSVAVELPRFEFAVELHTVANALARTYPDLDIHFAKTGCLIEGKHTQQLRELRARVATKGYRLMHRRNGEYWMVQAQPLTLAEIDKFIERKN